MTEQLLHSVGLYGATLLVCFIAGLVPFVNAEVFLFIASAKLVDSPHQLPMIVALAAIGQMLAKVILYYAGMGMFEVPKGRWKEKIERARQKMLKWEKQPYLIYAASASIGLPPLYLTTFAAGAMRINFTLFCVIGLAGRVLRFAVLVAIPWL
jgi:membrane protein YqaA with SNARE-associated domain